MCCPGCGPGGPVKHFPASGMFVVGAGRIVRPNLMLERNKLRPCRGRLRAFQGTGMRRVVSQFFWLLTFCCAATAVFAQSDYQVVTVTDGGTISGTVKWSGQVPQALDFPLSKDPQICDPDSKKTVEIERLIVGPQGGVANTVVYLKDISSGKAMDLPEQRRHLDQKRCRYIPHILLVPEKAALDMVSSDPTLHTLHMERLGGCD